MILLLCLRVNLSKSNFTNFRSINIFLEIQNTNEKGLHGKKVTACAAMGIHGFIGPFPFEIDRATATINSAIVMLLFLVAFGDLWERCLSKPFVKISGSSKIW